MIRCVNCRAPIDLNETACWHCQASTADHPLRTDIRYLIGYSRLSRIISAISALLVFGLLVLMTFSVFFGNPSFAEYAVTATVLIALLIVLCRLIL